MNRLAKLQLVGPFALAFAIIAGELAAYMLAHMPSSMIAWYLNVEVFGIFQRSHYVLSDKFDIPYFQLLFVAIPILLLAGFGLAHRRPLTIAAASNLSFVYALFLSYSWHVVDTPAQVAIAESQYFSALSQSVLNLTSGPQLYVLAAVLIPSALSFAASHLFYIRNMRQA